MAQLTLNSGRSMAGEIVVSKPLFWLPMAPTPWIWLQAVTQRRQRMHLDGSRVIEGLMSIGAGVTLLGIFVSVIPSV